MEAHSLSVLTDGRFEMGIGTGSLASKSNWTARRTAERAAGPGADSVTALRDLDGPDLHTPVVMAVRGPRAQALAADLADTVTFALMPGDDRVEITRVPRLRSETSNSRSTWR